MSDVEMLKNQIWQHSVVLQQFMQNVMPKLAEEYLPLRNENNLAIYYAGLLEDYERFGIALSRLSASVVKVKDSKACNQFIDNLWEAIDTFKIQLDEEIAKKAAKSDTPLYNRVIEVRQTDDSRVIASCVESESKTVSYTDKTVAKAVYNVLAKLKDISNTAIVCKCGVTGCGIDPIVPLTLTHNKSSNIWICNYPGEPTLVGVSGINKVMAVLDYFYLLAYEGEYAGRNPLALNVSIPDVK